MHDQTTTGPSRQAYPHGGQAAGGGAVGGRAHSGPSRLREDRADLAARAGLGVHVVDGAEDGTGPAWSLAYPEFMALADALAAPHSSWRELFETAAACDLLVTCLLDGDQAMATDVLANDDTRTYRGAAAVGDHRRLPGRPATPGWRRRRSRDRSLPVGCWARAAGAAAPAGGGAGPVEFAGRLGRRRDPRRLRG